MEFVVDQLMVHKKEVQGMKVSDYGTVYFLG
jgi:hypothetical protein